MGTEKRWVKSLQKKEKTSHLLKSSLEEERIVPRRSSEDNRKDWSFLDRETKRDTSAGGVRGGQALIKSGEEGQGFCDV